MGRLNQQIELECTVCSKKVKVTPSRAKKFKACSKQCLGKIKSKTMSKQITLNCTFYNKEYSVKKSRSLQSKFCSAKCKSKNEKITNVGVNNPNYKGREFDSDGYAIHISSKTKRRTKIHKEVALEILELEYIPKGYHIHHRDADHLNNEAENLSVLSVSDHRWIHKQFGNLLLWGIYHSKIELEEVLTWCSDSDKASKILNKCILNQKKEFNDKSKN